MTGAPEDEAEASTFLVQIDTVATPGAEEFLGAVGQVLSRSRFAPTRIGPKDPARTPVEDLPAQLRELAGRQARQPTPWALLATPERGESGTVKYTRDPFRNHPPGFAAPSRVDLTLRAEDDAAVAALGELVADLAEATQALAGFVTSRRHEVQLRTRFEPAQRAAHGGPPSGGAPPTWQPPPYGYDELVVRDVRWIHVFGPGYAEKWGTDRLERAGVRRRRLDYGGYVVWATDDPPPYDDGAARPEDYSWKASVYDAVGPEPFLRSDRGWNDFGEHVPLMSEHAAALRP